MFRFFSALGHALKAFWLGIAHGVGAAVRRVGHTARELDPEHRRDGIGLLLIALSVVVAASVWWQLPGGVGEATRTVVNGSVGLLGWFVPNGFGLVPIGGNDIWLHALLAVADRDAGDLATGSAGCRGSARAAAVGRRHR